MSEVKQHQKGDSMWTVLKGRVYNLSPYMRFHPGGIDMIFSAQVSNIFWSDFSLDSCIADVGNPHFLCEPK